MRDIARLALGMSFSFPKTETILSAYNTFVNPFYYVKPVLRIDGGGPWEYKPIRKHRKFKGYRRTK